jgi:hypothetical protein
VETANELVVLITPEQFAVSRSGGNEHACTDCDLAVRYSVDSPMALMVLAFEARRDSTRG